MNFDSTSFTLFASMTLNAYLILKVLTKPQNTSEVQKEETLPQILEKVLVDKALYREYAAVCRKLLREKEEALNTKHYAPYRERLQRVHKVLMDIGAIECRLKLKIEEVELFREGFQKMKEKNESI